MIVEVWASIDRDTTTVHNTLSSAVRQWLCVHGILMDQVLSAVIVTSVQLSGQTDTEVTFKLDGIAITSVLIFNAHHLY